MTRRTRKLLIVLVAAPIVLGGLGGIALVVRKQQVERSINHAYTRGRAAFEAREHQTALPLIARYVGRNRDDVDALLMLAECRAMVPKPEGTEHLEAARYAEAALVNDPNNVRALELLIGLYGRIGFVTELNRACERLLAIDPDHTGAMAAKSRALIMLGRYDEARSVAEQLATHDGYAATSLRYVLETRRQQGASAQDLVAEAAEAARRWPDSFEVHTIHAQTLLGVGDTTQASALLSRVAGLRPPTLRALSEYLRLTDVAANLLRLSGPDAEGLQSATALRDHARSVIESALGDERLARGAASIGASWEWRSRRFDEAQRWIDRGLDVDPASPPILAWRALLERDRGEAWTTHADALRALNNPQAAPWVALLDALGHIDRQEWAEAGEKLHAIKSQSEHELTLVQADVDARSDASRAEDSALRLLALYYHGYVNLNRGDWRIAVQQWTSLADQEPAWSLPLVAASRALLDRGQVSAAFDNALRAFRIRSGANESLLLASALVARMETEGPSNDLFTLLTQLLDELEANDGLRGAALTLRVRADAARHDQAAVNATIDALGAVDTPLDTRMLVEATHRLRAAGLDGWETLMRLAEAGGATAEPTIFRAVDAATAGRTDEALSILRQAAAAASGRAAVPFRMQEARILAATGMTDEARTLLRTLSHDFASDAPVQLEILEQPAAWTDAALVEAVVQRLRSISGDDGVEWRLAEATRLLTFNPDPARAQEVIVPLTRIVRDNPRNAQALSLLSEWMLLLDDEPAAIEYLTRAVDVRDSPPSLYPRLIDLLRRAGRRDDARARLEQFSVISRLPTDLLRTRARLLAEFRLTELARRDYELLARLGAPEDRTAYAAILFEQGSVSLALETLEQALTTPGLDRERFLVGAELMIDAGYAERALVLLEARAEGQNAAAAQADKGRLLERAGRHDEAEQTLRIAAEGAAMPEAYVEYARYLMRRSRPGEARDVIAAARARGLTSSDLDTIDVLASAITEPLTDERRQAVIDSIPPGPARDLAEATRWYDANPNGKHEFVSRLRAITTQAPQLVLAWQFLTATLLELGEIEQASVAARAAGSANPASPVAAGLEANTLLLAGRFDEARSAAERWRVVSDDPFEPVLALATVEIHQGRNDAARALLDSLVRDAETRAEAYGPHHWVALIARYAQIGNVDRARTLASKGDNADLQWATTMLLIAGREATPIDAARAWLRDLTPSVSSSADGLAALADAYAALADRSLADEDVQAAIEALHMRATIQPPTTSQSVFEATLLERLDRYTDAEAMYRRAIKDDADHWVALNNLAYMLLRRGAPPGEALTLARRANQALERVPAPNHVRASVLHTLAVAQWRTGDTQDALGTIRRALTLDSTSAEVRLTEVEVVEATGDTDRARAAVAAVQRQIDAGVLKTTDRDLERLRALTERLGQ